MDDDLSTDHIFLNRNTRVALIKVDSDNSSFCLTDLTLLLSSDNFSLAHNSFALSSQKDNASVTVNNFERFEFLTHYFSAVFLGIKALRVVLLSFLKWGRNCAHNLSEFDFIVKILQGELF